MRRTLLKLLDQVTPFVLEYGIVMLKRADLDMSMPNIPTKTMGGEFFWEHIGKSDELELQCHSVLGNYRLLNKQNVRVAWGSERQMKNYLQSIVNQYSLE